MNIGTLINNTIDNKVNRLLDCDNILVIGPKGSGKTLVSIKYLLYGINNYKCLYFTSLPKQDLLEKISILHPNLEKTLNKNLFIYQGPKPNLDMEDDYANTKIILEILNPVVETRPDRIVFDEITPYLAFNNLQSLKKVFNTLIKKLEYNKVKFLFTAAEPVSTKAQAIINILKGEFSFYLNLSTNPVVNNK